MDPAGAISFASPCCLPLVPGYLAYLAGLAGTTAAVTGVYGHGGSNATGKAAGQQVAQRTGRARLVMASLLFVAGFTVVFTAAIMSVLGLSDLLLRGERLLQRIGGVVTSAMGLVFLGLDWCR